MPEFFQGRYPGKGSPVETGLPSEVKLEDNRRATGTVQRRRKLGEQTRAEREVLLPL